jgi:membrane-associated phospholipid phosphatase
LTLLHVRRYLILSSTCLFAMLLFCWCITVAAQTVSPLTEKSASAQIASDAKQVAKNFAHDQVQIFESPVRIAHKPGNLVYLVPFAVAGALIPADRHIEPNPSTGVQNAAQDVSTAGLIGTAATVGGLYLYGVAKHDNHAHEAGMLGTESFVDTLLLYGLTNVIAGRARPDAGNHHGDFFVDHTFDTSFPSGHSSLTWSMTTVLADEYPSTKSQLFWYAVGSTVSITRVVGRKHFTSDVIVGTAMGYLIGRYVFHAHGHHRSK